MINIINENFLSSCATAQVAQQQGEFVFNKLQGKYIQGFQATKQLGFQNKRIGNTIYNFIYSQWVKIAEPVAPLLSEEQVSAGIYQHFGQSVGEQLIELESRHNGILLPFMGIISSRIPLCNSCPARLGPNLNCSRQMNTIFTEDNNGILNLYHLPIPLQPSRPRHKLK